MERSGKMAVFIVGTLLGEQRPNANDIVSPGRSKMEKGHGPFLCLPVEAEKKRKGMIE